MTKDRRGLCEVREKEHPEAIIRITESLGVHGDRSDTLHLTLRVMPEAMWAQVPASSELRIDDPALSGGLLSTDEVGRVRIDLKILMERFWSERLSEDLADLADVFAMDVDDALALLDAKGGASAGFSAADGGVPERDDAAVRDIVGAGVFETGAGTVRVSSCSDGIWYLDLYMPDTAETAPGGGTVAAELEMARDDRPGVIGELAFAGCDGIVAVELPASTREIQFCAFVACGNLSHVGLPDSIANVYPGAFAYSGVTDATWPRGCATVPAYAFAGCERLSHVELPEGVRSIEPKAFAGCTALRTVDIPSSCTKIAPDAFDKGVEIRHRG